MLPAPALHPPELPSSRYHCSWDVNSAVEWYLESGGVGHGTGVEAAQLAVPASPPGGHVFGLGGHLARHCMGHSPVIPGAGAAHCWRGATVAAAAAVRPALIIAACSTDPCGIPHSGLQTTSRSRMTNPSLRSRQRAPRQPAGLAPRAGPPAGRCPRRHARAAHPSRQVIKPVVLPASSISHALQPS